MANFKRKEQRIFDPGDSTSDDINKRLPFTRRIPRLKEKQLIRDSEIAKRLIHALDVLKMPDVALEIFLSEQKRLSDQRFWETMRTLWVTAGKQENYTVFRRLFASKRPHRDWFMTLEDAAYLDALPEEFEVYRAAYPEGDEGLSWTLDKNFVEKYAKDLGRILLTRKVRKSDVFAYISRRGESEILILDTVAKS
jgi:hypothetical protein